MYLCLVHVYSLLYVFVKTIRNHCTVPNKIKSKITYIKVIYIDDWALTNLSYLWQKYLPNFLVFYITIYHIVFFTFYCLFNYNYWPPLSPGSSAWSSQTAALWPTSCPGVNFRFRSRVSAWSCTTWRKDSSTSITRTSCIATSPHPASTWKGLSRYAVGYVGWLQNVLCFRVRCCVLIVANNLVQIYRCLRGVVLWHGYIL